tara:strand:- start:300 stop:4028 length:3729 start_codon:yes stop_codon:yes gene_type:complete
MSGPFGSQQWMYNASSGFYPYELNNSLKFEDGDSAYLSRTPSSAGNRTTWTLSMWVKRANISTSQMLFSAGTSSIHYANIQSDNTIRWRNSTLDYETTQVFRDSSAWYHLVFKWDTTNSTAADRAEIYVNNEKITVYDVKTNASSSENSIWNNNVKHTLGNYAYNNTLYFDGYMTEVIFIDGTALDPSSFGETKEGIWIPKDPTGLTYGTNGFRLPFTATTTANGFNTVTYEGTHPTQQSVEGVGFQPNFVWVKERDGTASHGLFDSVRGVEKRLKSQATDAEATSSSSVTSFHSDGFTVGNNTGVNSDGKDYVAWCWGGGTNDKTYTVTVVDDSGNKYRFDGHGTSSITLELTEGATYTFNYPSAHPLRFSTTSDGTHGGGSEYTTGVTHVSGTQTTFTVPSGAPVLYYYCSIHSGMGGQVNTNTTDGPTHAEGTILSRAKPNADYGFSIVTWTGNGTDGATVGHGLSQTPEMIIIKKRANNSGGNIGNWITQHVGLSTTPEATSSTFTLSGYTNGAIYLNLNMAQSSYGFDDQVNGNTDTFVAYCFHSVDGYQKLGSYTGTGSSGNSITGLGFKPAWIMIKRTDSADDWCIYDNTRHPSASTDTRLEANDTAAEVSASSIEITFDSDGFTANGTNSSINTSGGTYIYLAIADTRDALFTSDASGNGNNWTPNALQHSDVMPDTPTDGFAVLNGITSGSSVGTLTEGNLQYQGASSQWESKVSTIGVSSGKWYYEVNPISGSSSQGIFFGIINMSDTYLVSYLGNYGNSWGYYGLNGAKYNNAAGVGYGATVADGDIVGVALDVDAGTLTFYKNGVSQGVAFSGLSLGGSYDTEWFLGLSCYGTAKAAINFGQDSSFSGRLVAQGNADDNGKGDFYYAPPSGHLALCNANLPDPAIDPAAGDAPEDHFNTVFYSGNSGSGNAVTGVGFQPDWTWVKSRNTSGEAQKVVDSVRGAGLTVFPSGAFAETDYSGGVGFDSFDADGFTVSHNAANNQWNVSGRTYVAWNWKAGGTAVANDDGDIDTNVSVNDDAGFSIISYTGNGSSSIQTIGHGLSTKPDLAFIKVRTQGYNWMALFDCLNGSFDYIQGLNTTAVAANYSGTFANASTLTLLASSGNVNGSGENYICYCFASKDGFSRMGQYIGNGSSNGPFMYTGFRPAFVMVKAATGAVQHWWMFDNKREGYNVDNDPLYANLTSAEGAQNMIDFYSNGFKIRNSSASVNGSNVNYLVMAFAEQPFKYANAR